MVELHRSGTFYVKPKSETTNSESILLLALLILFLKLIFLIDMAGKSYSLSILRSLSHKPLSTMYEDLCKLEAGCW